MTPNNQQSLNELGGLTFSIHGRATVQVDADTPSLDILRKMFAPFVTAESVPSPDITVTSTHPAMPDASHAEEDYRYDERSVWLAELDVQVGLEDGRYTVSGTRELLTAVLPLVDQITASRGAAMVHATMVDIGGRGVLMPAWGGVGKTSTMAKLVKEDDCRFMGDDWGFLTATGDLLGYAKPMFIKPHHRPIYPHLFDSRRKPMVPPRLSRPLGRLTTLVHPMITRFPRQAAMIRRWSPEHIMVTPEEAFPGHEISTAAPITASVFVERFDGAEVSFEERSTEWMVARIVGNFYSEMAQHSRDVTTALSATGLAPLHLTLAAKAALVAEGLGAVPCSLLRVPASWSADKASDAIAGKLLEIGHQATPALVS